MWIRKKLLYQENHVFMMANKVMSLSKFNVIAEIKTAHLLVILCLHVWLQEKQLQLFEEDQWIEVQSMFSNMFQDRFLVTKQLLASGLFQPHQHFWKRLKVKREKQEIRSKSESTEVTGVDDLSEYLIENRFATDAQKTGFEIIKSDWIINRIIWLDKIVNQWKTNIWSKLKGSKPADWKFCRSQINDSEWYCSGTTCKSICQGVKPAPLLPLKGIKPIQGMIRASFYLILKFILHALLTAINEYSL